MSKGFCVGIALYRWRSSRAAASPLAPSLRRRGHRRRGSAGDSDGRVERLECLILFSPGRAQVHVELGLLGLCWVEVAVLSPEIGRRT